MYISLGSWVLFLLLLCNLMVCANNQVHYGLMVVPVCLHITLPHCHRDADGIELIKCLSDTLSSVSKIKSIFSVIFHTICGAMCIQLTHL